MAFSARTLKELADVLDMEEQELDYLALYDEMVDNLYSTSGWMAQRPH